jgi:hypothetical protein
MTLKNNTRKFNITTKVNKDEYSLLLNAFNDSNYQTPGHFYRDTILVAVSPHKSKQYQIPELNEKYANELVATLKCFNQLIEHLNLSLVDSELKLNSDDRKKYINAAIELSQEIHVDCIFWLKFFRQSHPEVIEQIALRILTLKQLENLIFLRKNEEEY